MLVVHFFDFLVFLGDAFEVFEDDGVCLVVDFLFVDMGLVLYGGDDGGVDVKGAMKSLRSLIEVVRVESS